MKFGDFEFSFAVSAVALAVAMLLGVGEGISPLFALGLLAASQAGFFALQAIKKSGVAPVRAEYLFISVITACFVASALSLSALYALFPLLFVPIMLCLPAICSLASGFFSPG